MASNTDPLMPVSSEDEQATSDASTNQGESLPLSSRLRDVISFVSNPQQRSLSTYARR